MNIKHYTLAALFLLIAAPNTFGQIQKGEQNLSLTAIYSSKAQDIFVNDNAANLQPATMEMGLSVGYTYFLFNRFSIGGNIMVPYTRTPIGKTTNGSYMYNTTYGFQIGPELRDYVPITDQLYWVISASAAFGCGKYHEDLNGGSPIETNYKGAMVIVAPLGLEFRASDRISIGLTVGAFVHSTTQVTVDDVTVKSNQTMWQLNRSDISLNIWF